MKHFPVLFVQRGELAAWLTLLGIQGSAPVLGSAWSSGKGNASNDYWVGKNYKEGLEADCREVQGGPMTFKQEHFPLLLVRRVNWCCVGAIGLPLKHV